MKNITAELVDDLFAQVLEKPVEQQQVFLLKTCGNNVELKIQVEKLLKTFNEMGNFLEDSAESVRDSLYANITTEWSADNNDRIGTQIERFTIINEIGRGGGSTVYEGHRQEEDWQQKSAIKILRRGLDTDDVLRRFHAERQILTHLNHPGIAAIHDAGITKDGLPWFAMELVEGENIADYCSTHQLDLKQRLRLFLSVLDVVKFAHQHLIVHRDIKPSNILVSNEGKVKLLDFGISKVLSVSNDEILQTYTRTGINPSTPNYASPEQITGSQITTTTDIYQLGLLLCKILTNALPVKTKHQSSNESRATPKKPSDLKDTVLNSSVLNGKLTSIPSKQLFGDLDTIILKAIRFEPENRYQSTDSFANDICRFLENRPIEAQKLSLGYRLKKLLQRQPWALPVSLLAIIGIVGYMFTINIYNRQLQQERDLKIVEAERAEGIKSFLVDFLKAPDPFEGEGFDVTMKQALDNAANKVDSELKNQPLLQAEVYGTLATVYKNLDLHQQAVDLWSKELKIIEQTNENKLQQINIRRERAFSLFKSNGKNKQKAISNLLKAKEAYQNQFSSQLSEQALTEKYLGEIELETGDLNQAFKYFLQSEELVRLQDNTDKPLLVNILLLISDIHSNKGQFEEALVRINEAEKIMEELYGRDTLPFIQANMKKADALARKRQFPLKTLKIYQNASNQFSKLLGPNHSETLSALSNTAYVYNWLKEHQKAENIYKKILTIRKKKYAGRKEMKVVTSMISLATTLTYLNKHKEAVKLLIDARKQMITMVKPGHITLGYSDMTLAHIFEVLKNYSEMERVAKRALDIFDPIVDRGRSVREAAQCRYAAALSYQGQKEKGITLLKDALTALKKVDGSKKIIAECNDYFKIFQ